MRVILARESAVMLATWMAVLSSCATAQHGHKVGPPEAEEPYGPLVVNVERGSDFYVAQDGAFAPATLKDGALFMRLRNRPFQIGTNSHQLNICLTQEPAPEIRADPAGHKASCLSGPMQGAMEANSNALLVYSGRAWSDGNTALQDGSTRKAEPLAGYARAYQIDELLFVDQPGMDLARFRGTLFGYIVVYKQDIRRNRDIMPIRLVIGGE